MSLRLCVCVSGVVRLLGLERHPYVSVFPFAASAVGAPGRPQVVEDPVVVVPPAPLHRVKVAEST